MENNLTASSFDSEAARRWSLEVEDLMVLEEYALAQDYETPRAIGLGYEQKMFYMSVGFENSNNGAFMTKGVYDTTENLMYYLDWADINYIILPQDNGNVMGYEDGTWKETYAPLWDVYNRLLLEDGTVEICTDKYRMIDITSYVTAND